MLLSRYHKAAKAEQAAKAEPVESTEQESADEPKPKSTKKQSKK